jgi:hypothetical protein
VFEFHFLFLKLISASAAIVTQSSIQLLYNLRHQTTKRVAPNPLSPPWLAQKKEKTRNTTKQETRVQVLVVV